MRKKLGWFGAGALLALMLGCDTTPGYHQVNGQPYDTYVVEGCEYFRFSTHMAYSVLTHKGNCKNPIHCYRSER